jgi:hypothetical protein
MVRTVDRKQRMVVAQCQKCGHKTKIPDAQHELGQVIQAYKGGGTYGTCFKCKRTGTQMIVELPPQGPVLPPSGWTKHPGGEE